MSTSSTWKCPGCGALITLPAGCGVVKDSSDYRRLNQLAHALCGCWVVTLPEGNLGRLLGAIMDGEEAHSRHNRRIASRDG